ncbi:hypothetical protein PspLS_05196 [Pyricularia sp. CBS 133598]|nr:hypothetical protein PspLS_05196 [Pyricularia sp. CBS 133598]
MKPALICTVALLAFAKDVLATGGDEKYDKKPPQKSHMSSGDWLPYSSGSSWPAQDSAHGKPQSSEYGKQQSSGYGKQPSSDYGELQSSEYRPSSAPPQFAPSAPPKTVQGWQADTDDCESPQAAQGYPVDASEYGPSYVAEGHPVPPYQYGPPQSSQYRPPKVPTTSFPPAPPRVPTGPKRICRLDIEWYEHKCGPARGRRPGAWVLQWVKKDERLAAVGVRKHIYGYWCLVTAGCNVECAGLPGGERTWRVSGVKLNSEQVGKRTAIEIQEASMDDSGVDGVPGKDPDEESKPIGWKLENWHLTASRELNRNFPYGVQKGRQYRN